MSGRERSLMRIENPTLEQCGDSVDARHGNMGWIAGRSEHGLFMHIFVVGQSGVTSPAISAYQTAGGHCVANERYQIRRRCVGNMTHSHPSKTSGLLYLYGNHDDAFIGATASNQVVNGVRVLSKIVPAQTED